jgi:hypothetical protein
MWPKLQILNLKVCLNGSEISNQHHQVILHRFDEQYTGTDSSMKIEYFLNRTNYASELPPPTRTMLVQVIKADLQHRGGGKV